MRNNNFFDILQQKKIKDVTINIFKNQDIDSFTYNRKLQSNN